MMKKRHASLIYCVMVILLMVASILLVGFVSRHGIGLFGDNRTYFRFADSLDITLLQAHPPLYPLILALIIRALPFSITTAATLVNMMTFPLLIGLALYASRTQLHVPRSIAVIAGLSVMLAYPVVYIHAYAFTEPLFLVWAGWSLFALIEANRRPAEQLKWIYFAGACAGFAVLTRYAGVALVFYGGVILLFAAGSIATRLRNSILFGSIAAIPLLLFLLAKSVYSVDTGQTVGRTIQWARWGGHVSHVWQHQLPQCLTTFSEWFVPYRMIDLLTPYITSLLLVAGMTLLFRGTIFGRSRSRSAALIYLGWPLTYVLFLLIWITLSGETEVLLRHRIMAPAAYALFPWLFVGLALSLRKPFRWALPGSLVLVLLFLFNTYRSGQFTHTAFHEGVGIVSRAWQESETLHYLLHEAPAVPFYTNAHVPLRLLGVTKEIRGYPRKQDQRSGRSFPHMENEITYLQTALEHEAALILVFDLAHASDAHFPPYMMTPGEMQETLDLIVLREFDDGRLIGPRGYSNPDIP